MDSNHQAWPQSYLGLPRDLLTTVTAMLVAGMAHRSLGLTRFLKSSRLKRNSLHSQCCSAYILEGLKVEMELSVTVFMLLNHNLACGSILYCTPCGLGLAKLRQLSAASDSSLSQLNSLIHSAAARKESLTLLN